MRNKLLPLLALGAIAVPVAVHSQTPQHGIRTGNIAATYTGEVLPGQAEAFKQMVVKLIAAAEQEPGTLAYEWSMRADGKTFDVVEIYQDSAAFVAHMNNVLPKFGEDLGKTQSGVRAVVYGNPDAEARKIMDGFHAEYEAPFGGFIR